MQFLVETTKTKQIHANSEPKPWFLKKTKPTTIPNQKTAVI